MNRNILGDQLHNLHHLPQSEHYDSVLSVGVADLDFDGEMEILVTTYGRELLVYKENTAPAGVQARSSTVTPTMLVPVRRPMISPTARLSSLVS